MTFAFSLHWGGQGFITPELHQTGSEKKREKKYSIIICFVAYPHQGTTERWNTISSNFQYIFLYSDLVFQKIPRRNTIPWPEDVWEYTCMRIPLVIQGSGNGQKDFPSSTEMHTFLCEVVGAPPRGSLGCRECATNISRNEIYGDLAYRAMRFVFCLNGLCHIWRWPLPLQHSWITNLSFRVCVCCLLGWSG